ncbi:MAG TPA: hypothetical protein VID93_01780 [Acidimicrobiales bacterium]
MPVDLEQALTELADSLEFPGSDALAGRVTARLAQPVVVPFGRRPNVRKALAVAAAAVVIAGLVLAGSPRARRAVADLLGIGGIEIQTSSPATGSTAATTVVPSAGSTSSPATFPPDAAPGPLDLGSPIGVEEGAARIGVPAPVPTALGPPAAVYVGSPPATGRLSLVWPPSTSLPATRIPDVGALLTVFRASVEEGYFLKVLDPETTYERVTVGGHPAVWLAGEPHAFLYRTSDGQVQEETLRLAGNTLIWTVGPFTYRLESALDRDAAIALADSVPST